MLPAILRFRWPTRWISRPCWVRTLIRTSRRELLPLCPTWIMRIGIDLGGTKIEAIAIDGTREVLRRRVDTPRGDYTATISTVRELVSAIERESGTTGTVGIGIPGAISPATGLVKNANST